MAPAAKKSRSDSRFLQEGSKGAAVAKLQRRLKQVGFNPGTIDGDFGPATRAAVIGFQKSAGLLADGIAGPHTQTALKLTKNPNLPSVIAAVTPNIVSKMFPLTPLDNIKNNLPFVLDGLMEYKLVDKSMVLMSLATIRAETESFEPISEFKSRYNSSPGGHPFDLYDHRTDLGNGAFGDGEKYRGRGYVQLTGKFNYQKYGQSIGLGRQLIIKPLLANEPDVAGKLLAVFLRDKERQIKESLTDGDLRAARRFVNGGSHGLERFTDAYHRGKELIA